MYMILLPANNEWVFFLKKNSMIGGDLVYSGSITQS